MSGLTLTQRLRDDEPIILTTPEGRVMRIYLADVLSPTRVRLRFEGDQEIDIQLTREDPKP